MNTEPCMISSWFFRGEIFVTCGEMKMYRQRGEIIWRDLGGLFFVGRWMDGCTVWSAWGDGEGDTEEQEHASYHSGKGKGPKTTTGERSEAKSDKKHNYSHTRQKNLKIKIKASIFLIV